MLDAMVDLHRASNCRSCGHGIEPFMDFGCQPLAQVAGATQDAATSVRYRLQPAICLKCGLFQIMEVPNPELLFTNSYPYRTGTSLDMCDHLRLWADELLKGIARNHDPFIVEIGCNDGTFLQNVVKKRIRHLGVDPATVIERSTGHEGISILKEFFNNRVASQIRKACGPADVIVAANVIAHMPNVLDTAAAVATLLKDNGTFTFEAIYLGDLIKKTLFDQLYAEHVFTFSVQAVINVFGRCGLDLVNIEHQDTHGGSMRYTLAHRSRRTQSQAVAQALEEEKDIGLNKSETYQQFARRCNKIRDDLRFLLTELRNKGSRVAGYGATAKGTTLLNWCELDSDLVSYVADNTPSKQGKVIPGTSIVVRSPEYFQRHRPEYALLLAWNHRPEIERKEIGYRNAGGKWILYEPEVTVQ